MWLAFDKKRIHCPIGKEQRVNARGDEGRLECRALKLTAIPNERKIIIAD
jgi:hypothetical protein